MRRTWDSVVNDWFDRIDSDKYFTLNTGDVKFFGDNTGLSFRNWRTTRIAEPLRTKSGKLRGLLINGDRAPYNGWHTNPTDFVVTVASYRIQSAWTQLQEHQREWLVRQRVGDRRPLYNIPRVILPFSVLDAAGIDRSSIQVIEVTADQRIETEVRYDEVQPRWRWRSHAIHGSPDFKTAEEGRAYWRQNLNHWERPGYPIVVRWTHYPRTKHEINVEETDLADWPEGIRNPYRKIGSEMKLHPTATGWREIAIEEQPDGSKVYIDKRDRHVLGESVIRAQVVEPGGRRRWAYFLSGWDHNEAWGCYFFSELPKGAKPKSVAEAYELLKPEVVKQAEEWNRLIWRQGDIFAVAMPDFDRDKLKDLGADFGRSAHILGTNHVATKVAVLPNGATFVSGILHHRPAGRRADHARRHLDKCEWFLAVKNTVPIAA